MSSLLLMPFALQAVLIFIDEFYCHRKREIPRWERIGHPLDTLTLILAFAFLSFSTFSQTNLWIYVFLSSFSCLFVTKDEFIHTKFSNGFENLIHALLFLVHPLVFIAGGLLWLGRYDMILKLNLVLLCLYAFYQAVYWNLVRKNDQANK